MRTIRSFVDAPLSPGATVTLSELASGHLVRVLRLGVGDAVVLFNGAGQSSPDLAQQATVVLPDGRTAKVVFTPGEAVTVASAGQVIAK